MDIVDIGMAVYRVATAIQDEGRVGRLQQVAEGGHEGAKYYMPDARRYAAESCRVIQPGDIEIWWRFRDAFPEIE